MAQTVNIYDDNLMQEIRRRINKLNSLPASDPNRLKFCSERRHTVSVASYVAQCIRWTTEQLDDNMEVKEIETA